MRSTNPGFVPDSPFTRELTAKQLAFFSAFPKAELHCHLLGTTSRETFIDLVRDSDAPISMAEIEGFYTRGEKPVGVLRIFRALESSILKKPEYLKRITLEHLERTAAQGVRYIELFWNWTGLKHFMTYAEGQDAIVAGLIEGEEKYGIVGRLVPSIDREALPEDAVELVREMTAHRSPWVIGLGIDYRETLHEPENFWKAYRLARDAGFKLTAHAGEFGEHWRNVETAMDLLECERIDHGYTIRSSLSAPRIGASLLPWCRPIPTICALSRMKNGRSSTRSAAWLSSVSRSFPTVMTRRCTISPFLRAGF